MKRLLNLKKFFLKYKLYLIGGVFFVTISNFFGVLPPIIIRHSINLIQESILVFRLFSDVFFVDIIQSAYTYYLFVFGVLVIAFSIIRGLFMFFMRQTIIVMSRNIEFDQKNELFNKYQELSLAFFRRNNTGDLMARVSEDVGKVRMFTGPGLMYGINLIILFALVVSSMIAVDPKLTLYVLTPLPLLSFIIFRLNNIILHRSTKIQEKLSDLTVFTQEAFSGIRVIKSFGREKAFQQMFGNELEEFRRRNLNLVKADALFFPLILLLIGLSTILTIFFGGIQVMNGSISAGNIGEFVIYVNMLTWPVTSVGWVASIIQQASASQKRIDSIMETQTEIDGNVGLEIEHINSITFKDLGFKFPDSGIQALKRMNLNIPNGSTLGVIGRTGAGKSTLANLLTRLYDPTEGELLINNIALTKIKPSSLRQLIGYVPQDVFLFSNTIAQNVAIGEDKIDLERVKAACKMAAIHSSIVEFPEGYSTILGERGVTLSGGQKQRLAIARALYKKPQLYIFDDCLSALDADTEKVIISNLLAETDQVTTIIIAHRISSVIHADQIIVLDDGEIVEIGTHATLLKNNGFYSELYQKQMIDQEKPVNP